MADDRIVFDGLKETLKEDYLDWVDEYLEDINTPLSQRAFRASLLLLNEGLIEIKNCSKDEFIKSEYFSSIVNDFMDLYIEKYGDLVKSRKEKLSGMVLYHNQPVCVKFSPTTTRVEEEGKLAWLIFPDHLKSYENYRDFFDIDINIDSLENDDLLAFENDIKEIVALSRRFTISMMTSTSAGGDMKNMVVSVWQHVEKAVSDILSDYNENNGVACWELHLAIEKTFKIFLSQYGIAKPVHNLLDLHNEAEKKGLIIDDSMVSLLTDGKDAIKMRYGDASVSKQQAVESYRNTLNIICSISDQLKRTLSIYNAEILLKKLAWAR